MGPGPGPGPTWALGPLGPWPTWALGPLGPWPTWALGPLGPWPTWALAHWGGVKNGQKSEVLRMSWPIVENVRTSSDMVLVISRGFQLPYRKKSKKSVVLIKRSIFSVFFRIFTEACPI